MSVCIVFCVNANAGQNAVFCLLLVIVILCAGIREAASMTAAVLRCRVFSSERVLCRGINGGSVRAEATSLEELCTEMEKGAF